MLNPVKPSCLVSLSLDLIFHADDSFWDLMADSTLNPEKAFLVLSLCLSISSFMPTIPSGTSWQTEPSILKNLPVLSLYLTFRAAGSFRHLLADRKLNPEKPSCLVSLSLCPCAASSYRNTLAERMLIAQS